jgi:predicted patatin/cPLA2 family phospholipase
MNNVIYINNDKQKTKRYIYMYTYKSRFHLLESSSG